MELPKIYIPNDDRPDFIQFSSGFSLIEVVVVITIMGIILSATLTFSGHVYQSETARTEQATLVGILRQARADAMNNLRQLPRGVALYPGGYPGYVLFFGANYASSDSHLSTYVPAQYELTVDPASPGEVVFTPLSGAASYDGLIERSDGNRGGVKSTVAINYAGKISW
jgi:prepilin-type N-terminal cleavage/methylation domain-containing protein